jgi:hypothetical protein
MPSALSSPRAPSTHPRGRAHCDAGRVQRENRDLIIALAARYSIPAIYFNPYLSCKTLFVRYLELQTTANMPIETQCVLAEVTNQAGVIGQPIFASRLHRRGGLGHQEHHERVSQAIRERQR